MLQIIPPDEYLAQLPEDTVIAVNFKMKEVVIAYEGKIQVGKR